MDAGAVDTRRRGGRVRRRLAVPGARVALRRRLRARRPGAGLVLGRRAHSADAAWRPSGEARARADGRAADDAHASATLMAASSRYREALNQALREEMARDESVFLMGEDIGVFHGAFKVTDGPARGVRREARARHADLREHDRRHGRRRGDGRAAAGRRADDDQLLAARAGPDRQPRRAHPLHVRRPGTGAAGRSACRRAPATSSARRTRTASRRCSSTCPACSSPSPRTPADAKGLLKAAIRDDNPVDLHRARVPLRPARRGPRGRRLRRSASARRRSGARAPT